MKYSAIIRRGLIATASALVAVPAFIVLLSAALDAGYLRGPLIRFLATHTARSIRIDGSLKTHFLSRTPGLIAERVTIGNPPWTPPGVAAEVGKLTLAVQLPFGGRSFAIETLDMDGAVLHLTRDVAGHANWQRTDPDKGPQGPMPIIRSLSMARSHVELDDALRHLRFKGTVSAQGPRETGGAQPLRIEGEGELNGKQVEFDITGDPLGGASLANAYGFKFSENSSGSRLTGSGSLVQPFDFDNLDVAFEGAGADLADLYFLTGVTLINTGAYRLSGKLARRGTHSHFTDLALTSGQSDLRADVSIESCCERPRFEAQFNSKILHLADLGAQAAGREHDPSAGKLLLSNAILSPGAVRHGDWLVQFHAARVDVGRFAVHRVSAKVTIEKGVLVASPLSAEVFGGKLSGRVKFDGRTDAGISEVDLKVADARVGQLARSGTDAPPLDGSLQARLSLKGPGRSIHEVAAAADGTVTAVLTRGTIRSSLAESTGIDLRGLALLLTKSKRETGVSCAVASFQSHDGTWVARRLIMDTDPVLITGEGQVNLGSEALAFELRGHPKGVRLFRLHVPILVRGTLLHPAVRVEARNGVKPAAEAVPLGAGLPPFGAMLAFVDPALAKDADCASLEQRVSTSPP